MSIELNHIIVPAPDKQVAAKFLADILGVPLGQAWGPFVPLPVSNGVTLDYMDSTDYRSQHCAFLVDEDEFDAAFGRIREAGIAYWADPFHNQPNEINPLFGGRGVYFDDPAGHVMQLLTRAGTPPPN
ncbi:VOC family protein [Pseudonocardia acaciae]|uniref:VOC family protein n=1 Tax=Pseudonocardia acaciae TaxID=551276 RepID=UPI0004917FAF|nr:VOC family protein [Pseudonocardia acaciae]